MPSKVADPFTVKPESAYVEIDGPTATKMLACNFRNRPMNEDFATDMARDMLAEDFDDNGETIKFGMEKLDDGTTREILLDGQTRLRAVEIANEHRPGIKVKMLVVRNLDPRVALTIDSGKPRTYSHHLAMQGQTGSRNTASIVRRVVNFDHGFRIPQVRARIRLTNREIERYHHQHADELERAVLQGQRINREHGISPTTSGAAFVLMERIHRETAWQFFDDLRDWTNLSAPRHPVLALVSSISRRNRDGSMTPDVGMALLILGWNSIAKREITRTRFNLTEEQLTNDGFPKPEKPVWI